MMNLYRITLAKPSGGTHTKWIEARTMKRLRKGINQRLHGTKWKLLYINFERQTTYIKSIDKI